MRILPESASYRSQINNNDIIKPKKQPNWLKFLIGLFTSCVGLALIALVLYCIWKIRKTRLINLNKVIPLQESPLKRAGTYANCINEVESNNNNHDINDS